MASVVDVKIEKDMWVNLTAAAGASAGDDLLVQNIGGHKGRVENSVTIPSGDTVGLVISPSKTAQAFTEPTENVWGFGRGGATTYHIQVL